MYDHGNVMLFCWEIWSLRHTKSLNRNLFACGTAISWLHRCCRDFDDSFLSGFYRPCNFSWIRQEGNVLGYALGKSSGTLQKSGCRNWFHFYLRVWFDSSCWSSSKYIWLVRNYERAVDLKEPFMDVGIKLHCFSPICYNDNVSFIILNMQFLVENFFSRECHYC